MDDAVGRVLGSLRQHGIEDDTLIFFISDNGGPTPGNASRNDPLSGFKGQLLEGGIRVPYVMQWKRRLTAGGVIDWPVTSLDIFATALGAADAPPPPRDRAPDGLDLVQYVQHRSPPRRDALYWRFGEPRAIRMGNHKLLMLPGEQPALFDLSNDPAEKHDIAAANPEKVKQLRDAYAEWDRQMVAPRWGRTRPRRRQRRRDRMPAATRPTTR
jgi:arylsulfatase A-like enzyme